MTDNVGGRSYAVVADVLLCGGVQSSAMVESTVLVRCLPVDSGNREGPENMMGHREKLKGGDEYDYLTKARRYYGYSFDIKDIKRRFWKRLRQEAKRAMRKGNK